MGDLAIPAIKARGRVATLLGCLFALVLATAAHAEHNRLDLVTKGPTGGNGPYDCCPGLPDDSLAGMSADGSHLFFNTSEGLAFDGDGQLDVYDRTGGTTILVSPGTAESAQFVGSSADGGRVFFRTASALTPEDQDTRQDLYERSAGTTTLVSTGPDGGNGPYDVVCQAGYPRTHCSFSRDGTHVFFVTDESLVSADADTYQDVYERTGGSTRLVSVGSNPGAVPYPSFRIEGVSDDGGHVFFSTYEALVPEDTGASLDIYERFEGMTRLVSTGPRHVNSNEPQRFDTSSDGERAYFATQQALTLEDTDSVTDVYMRSNGTTTLVPGGSDIGTANWDASRDGGTVVFDTRDSLVPEDGDGGACIAYNDTGVPHPRPCQDVYAYSDGALSLVSTGPTGGSGGSDAYLTGLSNTADHIFFTTPERLVSTDADGGLAPDLYDRTAGDTTLVSTGPKGANGGSHTAFGGASADGSRVFFKTSDQLVPGDTDSTDDWYERFNGRTTLVFNAPYIVGVSEDGNHVVFYAQQNTHPEDSDSCFQPPSTNRPCQDLYEASIVPTRAAGYARPVIAHYLRAALVPAYKGCTNANSTHGGPLANPSCSPPIPMSDYLTIGTPDANGAKASSVGYVEYWVYGERPVNLTNGDQADVRIVARIKDVRRKSDMLDYQGELRAGATLRLTDGNYRDAPITDPPATSTDVPFEFVVPCAVTPEPSIGSTCSVATTADAVIPGMVTERLRAVWQMGEFRVFDGGADGDADTTGDNTLFARQGLFAP